ncbi:MAG TPA: glycoside hydrolase family 5 protein [Verrucomicrobiae bacterium]
MKRLVYLCILAAIVGIGRTVPADEESSVFVPENPPGMKPLPNHHTPAYRAAGKFLRGVNLGDYLESNRHHRWIQVSADEFPQIEKEGFDHVRVPIGWHQYAGPGPNFTLEPEIFSLADSVVSNALKNKLSVIINIHHFNALDRDPTNATPEFLAIWQQIAAHYQKFPKQLAFELDNEPHDAATTAVMNPIYARAIAAIRGANPKRTIFVEPGGWGSIADLKKLVLPDDDNVIVSVHCYDPFYFTHQGATWTGGETPVTGIIFPGPPPQPLIPDPNLKLKPYQLDWIKKYNTLPAEQNPSSPRAFTEKLAYLRAWSDYYGRPIHLGEFGAYTKADEASRINFYTSFRRAAEREKIGWCIWDWSAGFRYWDKANQRPMPGMRAALFGRQQQ